MTAIEALSLLLQRRREKRVMPDFIPEIDLFLFLRNYPNENYKQQLNEAFRQGKIKIHRTINGRSIELVE